MNIYIVITLVILTLIVLGIITTYNKLVRNKNQMQEAWSVIDVCLKKRYDLIPNLVETVKGYAAHEKSTLEEIIRYRSGAMQATNQQQRMQQEAGLGKALANLFVTVENYPDLKANTNFMHLQQQLTDLENELAMSRRYYNGTVRDNNTYMESFPTNIISGLFSFSKGTFFVAEDFEKRAPVVSFS